MVLGEGGVLCQEPGAADVWGPLPEWSLRRASWGFRASPGASRCDCPKVGGACVRSQLCCPCWVTLGKFPNLSDLGPSSGGDWYH